MPKEIERKFLIKTMPNISGLESILYERYFIFRNKNIEIRVQRKGSKYEFERKTKENSLTHSKQKFEISKEEFDFLKENSKESITRESFLLQSNPEISIKIYHGRFEGLNRVEVEFENEKLAEDYLPPDWFGEEITDTPLGKDSRLLDLTQDDFDVFLKKIKMV